MPNRILREGILTSERINSLGWEAEVFYRRLMSVVDDYGRFHAHPALLRAALFPLKLGRIRDASMVRLINEVEAAGLVRTYEAGGKRYVEMLDFRQRVRAHASKFPPPPDDGHPPAACQPSAGLGECAGEGEVKDGVEDEGGGEPPQAPPAPPPVDNPPTPDSAAPPVAKAETPAAAPLHAEIAARLREHGVNITSAHPHAQAWAARGLTVAHALEALAIARLRKPQGRIAPNYLAPIVEEMLSLGAARGKPHSGGAAPPAWWASEAATLARGRELGLNARPGEAMHEYRARLANAIAEKRAPLALHAVPP